MPFYLTQAKLSQAALSALIANPHDRKAPVAKLLEAVGGKLHHYFFCFGEYDVAILLEAPDNQSAAAAILAVAGSGAVTDQKTTVLLTMEDGIAAMTKAGSASRAYQPPTG
jgi:uncharacterized protein with GYD domain